MRNVKKLDQYYGALDAGRLPVERGRRLDADDLVRRDVIQEWMCHFRVGIATIERRHGIRFGDYFRDELAALRALAAEGLVEITDDAIGPGELGRLFPRNVAMVFDRYLRAADEAGPRFSRTV